MHAAALCRAYGLPFSAHTAPSLHAHLCCAAPGARHLEYFHDHARIEAMLFEATTTIGVRRAHVRRRALPRSASAVEVLGHSIAVKVVQLPDGRRRAKPEFDDVARVAQATGRSPQDIFWLASVEAERV